MAVPITPDQIAQLQSKVNKLVSDSDAATAATESSGQAHAALMQAQVDVVRADTDESAADAVVSDDLADLTAFVKTLVGTPPTGSPGK